ncbi:hypothetical protein A2116_01210 [Candidatus Jorgensenbacteria bacterium GWA1_49_17]|uniref:Uncharacterized protein n=1 Tax=Candidatus Jorgensenbacteria bacterium GWA1_49_17 TaxID=1798467 RepID=A0A1F6BT88_9BACT|nr:MAG: hypothetical protein A2116_01210 [Candidatus Jorgensenbacteria bacterium GWA1_49_17]
MSVGDNFKILKMIDITEKNLTNRYKTLPPRLKNAIDSLSTFGLIKNISKAYSLTDEDTEIIAAYTAYVLLGVLEPKNLFNEVRVYLPTNEKTTSEIIREINFQILFPLHEELENIYKLEVHIEKDLEKEGVKLVIETKTEKPPVSERLDEEKPAWTGIEIKRAPTPEEPQVSRPEITVIKEQPTGTTEAKPFVIHKEEGQRPITEEKKFKGFEFPFGIFDKENGKVTTGESVKVRVETPGMGEDERGLQREFAQNRQPEKRVVHYSEYRTPLTPFSRPEEEIIDLQTFTKHEVPPAQPKPAESPKPPVAEKPAEKPQELKKSSPSIEGNIIDLKNL